MCLLEKEMNKFWQWAQMSREQYARTPDVGSWEIDYPDWNRLYQAAYEVIEQIKKEKQDEKVYSLLLDVVSIDKENELVIEKIYNEIKELDEFYEIAKRHIQPNAKWQIAGMALKKNDKKAVPFLISNVDHCDSGVRISVLRALSKLSPMDAEEYSLGILQGINSERYCVTKVLKEISPEALKKAKEIINDEYLDIQKLINEPV